MTERLFGNQPIIISLDVDPFLFDRLKQIKDVGFAVAEINSTDEELLQKILLEFPSLRIGAGNITNTKQLQNCYEAGVHFITSPGFLPALVQTSSIYGINYLPGIATLSEAMQLMALGCHQARPYPADLSFCALLNKSFPMLRLFPAEIESEAADHYLSLPAVSAISLLNPGIKQLNALTVAISA